MVTFLWVGGTISLGRSLSGFSNRPSNGDFDDFLYIFEGSLEVKLPTIWTDEKAEVRRARREKSQRGDKSEEKRSEERRCRCAKR